MDVYRLLADAIVVVHLVYVAFVVLGMAAILAGIVRRWAWVRNFWFRTVHLLMIAVVVVESLCGILCPLTDWEDRLRNASGSPNEPGTFIGRWATRSVVYRPAALGDDGLLRCVWLGGFARLSARAAALALARPNCLRSKAEICLTGGLAYREVRTFLDQETANKVVG